jgi:hypothetical protein
MSYPQVYPRGRRYLKLRVSTGVPDCRIAEAIDCPGRADNVRPSNVKATGSSGWALVNVRTFRRW